ncbi:MAG: CRTAC1 family protein [Xenococcus sp. MO_188.B8]|nr:CRTAC1 family protein [Xenococcus sp. MO_188.B8]
MSKLLLRRSIVRISTLVTLALFVAVAMILWSRIDSVRNPLKSDRWFTQQQLGVTYDLNDLGVVDVNNDSWLDIFTTNHNARQSLLVNRASSGEFIDQLLELSLSQNSEFPGVEPSDIEPSIEAPGLYIYFDQADLVINAHDIDGTDSVAGQILLPNAVMIETKDNFKVSNLENDEKLNIEFQAHGNGQLIVRPLPNTYYLSPTFKLNERLPLDRVYVGSELIRPSTHDFRLWSGKDRHAMVWADFSGDEQLDVFIARGGASGRFSQNNPRNVDELMIQDNFTFKDRTAESDILKNGCPARQAASVDFDQDGQLDIYIVCGRGKPPRQFFPNQLHWQKAKGHFIDVAAERGLDIPEPGPFLWLDPDNDRDMDLFWVSRNNEFWLYVNRSGQFEPQLIGQNRSGARQLTMSDYDSDGDLDVFAASSQGSVLLTNVNGTYEITTPQSVGLPARASTAKWVDYNNDGLMDLHVLPGGIFRQRSDRRFEATHLLESKYFPKPFSTWFDVDNDGDRDLLIAIEDKPFGWIPSKLRHLGERIFSRDDKIRRLPKSKVILYRNVGTKHHWLQLQLIGKEGNRQAIGARVEVATPDGLQLQQVGQAEGSKFSQGHYRLYFGLGQYESADSVRIFWPDGTLEEIENPKGDQLLKIKY